MTQDDDGPQIDIHGALTRSRIPPNSANLRLRDYGPDCEALYEFFSSLTGDDEEDRFWKSGRGWIVQGAPVRAMEAFHCILKNTTLLGKNTICISGIAKQLYTPFEDDRMEVWDAKVIGMRTVYDPSYAAYPFSNDVRYEAEEALKELLGRDCTPVLHVSGRWTDCNWYGEDLKDLLEKRCDVITVGETGRKRNVRR